MQCFDIYIYIYIKSAGNSKTRLDPWRNASDFEYCVLYGSRYAAKSAGYRGPAMCRAADTRVIMKAVFIMQGMKAGHCCFIEKKKKNQPPRTDIFFLSSISGNEAIERQKTGFHNNFALP